MTVKYFGGQAIPGAESRTETLRAAFIGQKIGTLIYPGTFNVTLIEPPPLDKIPSCRICKYRLWPCSIATTEMIKEDGASLPGWIIRVDGESLPDYFVEIISEFNIRKTLKMENWPSFTVEIALELENVE